MEGLSAWFLHNAAETCIIIQQPTSYTNPHTSCTITRSALRMERDNILGLLMSFLNTQQSKAQTGFHGADPPWNPV